MQINFIGNQRSKEVEPSCVFLFLPLFPFVFISQLTYRRSSPTTTTDQLTKHCNAMLAKQQKKSLNKLET